MAKDFNDMTVSLLSENYKDKNFTPVGGLSVFMNKVREAFRGVEFILVNNNRAWVYYPNEPYPMGYIGYGDFRTEVVGDDTYMVASRTITNDKYASYQDQHHMKMTVNMTTAIRNAKRFLRNFSTREMARANVRDAVSKSQENEGSLGTEYRSAMRGLFDNESSQSNRMLTELRNLVDTGHEFVDPAFGSELTAMFKLYDDHKLVKDKPIHCYFVRVYERFGKQTFDVCMVDNLHKGLWRTDVSTEITRYTDDLPEDIMGKVSMLAMVENGTYVDDVGYRADEGLFYVVRS
jgi:hypothetical protein